MALVDSLLTAMVRANGDALVMHVGERPIVVAQSRSIDLSSHGLNLNAMVGMLAQLLPADAQASLQEFGAVEHRLPPRGSDQFTVVAARGGDDIWIEIRRRREDGEGEVDARARPAVVDGPATREAEVKAELSTAAQVAVVAEAEPEPAAVASPVEQAVVQREAEPELAATSVAETAPASEMESATEVASFADAAPTAEVESPTDVVPQIEGVTAIEAVPDMMAEPPSAQEAVSITQVDAALQPVSQPESVTTEAPIELPGGTDAPVPVEALAEEQEETAVAQDAEFPRPETEGLTASPLTAHLAVADGLSAVPAAGEPHTVPAMTSVIAGRHPGAAPAPPAAGPSSGGGMGTPPAAPDGPSPAAFTPGSLPSTTTPVTRTVRIEVPSRSAMSAPRATSADRLLRLASESGATELFLMTHARPYIRVAGEVRQLRDEPALSATELDVVLSDITPEPSRDAVSRGEPVEWLVELADVGRIRCASFRDHRGPGAIFHLLSPQATSAEQLGLEAEARALATEPDGLVLVAGPAGSDKSAILAAFVDEINRRRADYMITIEPCVYLVHENVQALVSQREVGADPVRAEAATRAALSENPDVLVIDNLASGQVAALAVDAASQGRLVLVSLEASSTAEAVQRLIDLIPAEGRSAARAALARTFRGAIAQQQLRRTAGGRVAVRELLIGTAAVSRVLADQARADVAAAIDAARDLGSTPLADAVAGYVKSGAVDVREAFRKAPNRERLVAALRAAGVSTAAIDPLQ